MSRGIDHFFNVLIVIFSGPRVRSGCEKGYESSILRPKSCHQPNSEAVHALSKLNITNITEDDGECCSSNIGLRANLQT